MTQICWMDSLIPARKLEYLVVSDADDVHACALVAALRMAGSTALLVDTSLFGRGLDIDILFGGDEPSRCRIQLDGETYVFSQGDPLRATWVRRRGYPAQWPQHDAEDSEFMLAECCSVIDTFYDVAADCSDLTINAAFTFTNGSKKASILRRAQDAGIAVPPSLLTRSAAVTDGFRQQRTCVFKPLTQFAWRAETGARRLPRVVDISGITGGEIFGELSPPACIQMQVNKQKEYKLCVVGEQAFVAEVVSRRDQGQVDVKVSGASYHLIARDHWPQALIAIAQFMRDQGMDISSADVLVDHRGRCWLIDVNPNGQVLMLSSQDECEILGAMLALVQGVQDPLAPCRVSRRAIQQDTYRMAHKGRETLAAMTAGPRS